MDKTERNFITMQLNTKYQLDMAVSNVVNTPEYYCYMLYLEPHETLDKLQKHLGNLADDIYDFRRTPENDTVAVTLVAQPSHLQVSKEKEKREVLSWSLRPHVRKPHHTLLGAHWPRLAPKPVLVDLSDPKQAHTAIFSSSGGGKSSLLMAYALGVMESSSPEDTELYLINTESNEFDDLDLLPHVRFIGKDEQDAVDVIAYLRRLVETDREMTNTIRRVLVIDEFQELTEGSCYNEQAIDDMIQLAKVGRKHRLNLALATQDPSGQSFPTAIQRNMKIIVAGPTTDPSYLKRYFKLSGVEHLVGDGDFIISHGGGQYRFKSYWLDERSQEDAIRSIQQRWGHQNNLIRFDQDDAGLEVHNIGAVEPATVETDAVTERPVTPLSATERRIRDDVEAIRPFFDEAYDFEAGKVRDGWGVRLIEAIYGERKGSGGKYRARMLKAVDYLLQQEQRQQDEIV